MAFVFSFITLLVQIALSSAAFMALSNFLHATWWDVIPALSFTEGFLMGVLFGCFVAATKLTVSYADFGQGIFLFIFYLVINPFLMLWIVGVVNDEIITTMPDISYGTAFVFTLISLGFGVLDSILTAVMDGIKES